jgi:hypothetical protein
MFHAGRVPTGERKPSPSADARGEDPLTLPAITRLVLKATGTLPMMLV